MNGMRPSGFCCRWECTKRSPTTRAPAMAPGSLVMTGSDSPLGAARWAAGPGGLGGGCGDLARCRGHCLSVRGAQFRLVLVQALHLFLQDAHRLAERARRGRELFRPEQHEDHQGDDQDLPWAIEQVT